VSARSGTLACPSFSSFLTSSSNSSINDNRGFLRYLQSSGPRGDMIRLEYPQLLPRVRQCSPNVLA